MKKITWYDAPWYSSSVIGSFKYRKVEDGAVLGHLLASPEHGVKNELITMLSCGFRPANDKCVSVVEEGGAQNHTAKLKILKAGHVYFSVSEPGGIYVIKTFFDAGEV